MEESVASLMDEIRGNLELLESNLPKRVDGWALSQLSKLPFKVLVYREALSWRMAELGRAALEEFEKDRLAAAIVLTRAAVETSAALWYLCAKVDAPPGMKNCEFEDRLVQSFGNQAANLPVYDPRGPNSNTFVSNVIAGAGGSVPVPPEQAPGWGWTPPKPKP